MSRSHCSSLVPLVNYPYDTDDENGDDPYGNDNDEDEEPPQKRPNLSS